MELSLYEVIRRPRVTGKVYRLNKDHKQLVLEVHPQANKPMIAEALEKIFKVNVEKVRVIVCKGKTRRVGRHITHGITRKKAIVTLKEGQELDAAMVGNTATMNQQGE
jgi:large subunit ribosomal protein L23